MRRLGLSKLIQKMKPIRASKKCNFELGLPISPFIQVQSIEEVHKYFQNLNLATDPLLTNEVPFSGYCYVCNEKVIFEVSKPGNGEPINWRETLRCPGCGLINRWRGCLHLFDEICQPKVTDRIYLTEALTPIYEVLATNQFELTSSEFFSSASPGELINLGARTIRNEDVTNLSFPNNSFDSILTFDVLEHVPNYQKALREFHRVLDFDGILILTAPFSFEQETQVRAVIEANGEIRHLKEPCYHGDPLSEQGVLAYYDFGMALLKDLIDAGFSNSYLVCYNSNEWGYPGANIAFVSEKTEM